MFSYHRARIKHNVMFRRSLPGSGTGWMSDDYSIRQSWSECGWGAKSAVYDWLVYAAACRTSQQHCSTVITRATRVNYAAAEWRLRPQRQQPLHRATSPPRTCRLTTEARLQLFLRWLAPLIKPNSRTCIVLTGVFLVKPASQMPSWISYFTVPQANLSKQVSLLIL